MVSLAELRARNVVPVWQESVAVVQELIQTVKATTGSAELLPDLEHVALIPNGDVVALPGSPEPASPVRHAAVMLKLLLEGVTAPPELEQFVTRNVAEPPQFDSVTEFSRNLAFFERPGRRADVERLVGRAVAAEQTTQADEELRRLKDRASEVTQSMAAPDFLQQPQKQVRTVPIPLVAVAGVALVAAGLWIWSRVSQPPTPAPVETVADAAPTPPSDPSAAPADPLAVGAPATDSPAAQPTQGQPTASGGVEPASGSATPQAPQPAADRSILTRAGDVVRGAFAWVTGSGSSAPAPAAPDPAAPDPGTSEGPAAITAAAPVTTTAPSAAVTPAAGARPRQARSTPAARTAPAPPPQVTVASASAAAPAPAPAPVETAPPRPTVVPAIADPWSEAPVEVYTANDLTVTPPVIVRPVLPKDPPLDVPPADIGVVEVVVDENGDVLHVKLISPANRYRERMLVSASKTWKFRPAYKDGRPVRYKTRVRLTI